MAKPIALRRFSGPVPTPRRGRVARRTRAQSSEAVRTLPGGRRVMLYPTKPQRAVLRRHTPHRLAATERLATIRRVVVKRRAATVARRALAARPALVTARIRRPMTQRRLLAQIRNGADLPPRSRRWSTP